MNRTKLGLLSLCAVIFGVLALSASAQAASEWMVNNVRQADWTAGLLVKLQGKLEKNHGILLAKVLGKALEILCTAADLEAVHMAATGTLTHGNVVFTGCITKIDGVVTAKCQPKSTGAPLGTILTNKIEGKFVLHELKDKDGKVIGIDPLIEINPIELTEKGEVKLIETFVTIELGGTCAIGEILPVRGKLFLKDCLGGFETESVEHLFEQGPLTDLWVLSKTAEHAATLDGSALVKLVGTVAPSNHEGMTWSGLAP